MTVGLSDLEASWDGTFAFVWKPPPFSKRVLTPGMRGRDVDWLRGKLDELEGRTSAKTDFYNDELKTRVQAFQRKELLVPDGIAGVDTLARLSARLEPGAPLLSSSR